MELDELFDLVQRPLNVAKANIQNLNTKESSFVNVRSSFLNALSRTINEVEEQKEYLKNNIVQDHLVIAFFGETNAGKSTIIDTFRIIFDEETRRKAIKENGFSNAGVDGTIVGDGRSDYTKTYDEYNMTIDGREFTLIDVPGIEGNEAEYKEGIKKALQKAHCIFYVHGSDKKPNTKTSAKIKEYLNDWVGVYSINNIRGGSEQYDEDDERETLLTDSVKKASSLSREVFNEVLGKYYKGNIDVQGLLALCAKANFSPERKDLISIQTDLMDLFGDAETVFTFSRFQQVVDTVHEMSKKYKELILQSNKDKVMALARRSIVDVNSCISQEREALNELDQKLKVFEHNVTNTKTRALRKLNVKNVVEQEFDVMRYELYNAIDSKSEETVERVAKQQSKELERKLTLRINFICSNTMSWYANELNRLKRDLNSSINIENSEAISLDLNMGFNASDITMEMKDFDLGNAVSTAMSVAGIAMLVPGVGWILGGALALIGAIFGGIFGGDGRSEAKQKVDSTINEVCEKVIRQINNNVLKGVKDQLNDTNRKIIKNIEKERYNIFQLRNEIGNLKEDMNDVIKNIQLYGYIC